MKTITSSIYPAFAALVLIWLALSGTAAAAPPSNVSLGSQALQSNTSGVNDTALGYQALRANTIGSQNTATGSQALYSNTAGSFNTATGDAALFKNTTGNRNTATGYDALFNTMTGLDNTAMGFDALFSNTTGTQNTANGASALFSNTTGSQNTAVGYQALYSNTTGGNPNDGNTAIGWEALYSNTTGYRNVASGRRALRSNTTGVFNTANGVAALFSNTTGDGNTAQGYSALANNISGEQNTAFGNTALFNSTAGYLNIALGVVAGDLTTGDNNIVIGNLGATAESDTIRIGMEVTAIDEFDITHPAHTATYIAGISGQTAADGVAVYVNTDGKLGTLTSSARFKDQIKPMEKTSEAILALKPVTFRYKHEIDPKGVPQFGLVAEEVEKVNPALVAHDAKGEIYTVRYEAVNAMLLNEFLKEHRKVQKLEEQVEKLTTGLQKVSDQLKLSKPAPQVVDSNQ